MQLAGLTVFPVKSCAGVPVDEWPVGAAGLDGDRVAMVVDAASGEFLTQRTEPALALVRPHLVAGGIRLNTPAGSADIRWADGQQRQVAVWGWTGAAVDCGDAAADLLSDHLQRQVRLVRTAAGHDRAADAEAGHGVPVRFSDGFPLLVASAASLADLNTRLPEPLPMDRFRPNLVVSGAPPWAEDGWARLLVGDVPVDCVKPCTRCTITTVDQRTGLRDGGEPLRTLRTFRRGPAGVLFAVNAVAREPGRLRVGDPVTVLG